MRVGILTFWWSKNNYGEILQCYALQKALRDQGHDAFLIRYRSDFDIKKPLALKVLKGLNPALLCRYASYKRRHSLEQKEEQANSRHFGEFMEKYIAQSPMLYNHWAELCAAPPEADCYVVGSDLVWNFWDRRLWRAKNTVHAYFLDFGPQEVKRLSYAASWGRESIADEYVKEISPLLARFDYVSVREKSGLELCARCGRDDARWVCDPVFLLSAESWRALYAENGIERPARRYLFVYMVSAESDFDMEGALRFARERSLEVAYVTANQRVDRYEKTFATIPQWLALLDGAEFVLTNSFHVCAFSLIFQKRFGVVPRNGASATQNTRINSLFEFFGIESRLLAPNGGGQQWKLPQTGSCLKTLILIWMRL